jgi:hypothetical protein
VYAALDKSLSYQWQFQVQHQTPTLFEELNIMQHGKVILGYRFQPEGNKPWWLPFPDYLAVPPQKEHGKLQQPSLEAERMLWNLVPLRGVVLDCMMGTGSTAIACLKLGLHFFGCDKDENMVAIAKERIAAEGAKVTAAKQDETGAEVEEPEGEAAAAVDEATETEANVNADPASGAATVKPAKAPRWHELPPFRLGGGRSMIGF